MKFWIVTLLVMCYAIQTQAQLTIKNQLEYTHWEDYDRDIVENWSDLSYQKDFFQLGLRYEVNKPPDPFIFPLDTLLDNYELSYVYAEFYHKNLTATVGNFYTMFGRGLSLRTYEDRNLRVDNNIEGLKLNFSGESYKFQAIAGRMRDQYNRRKDGIYGADGEFTPLKNIQLGASYLYQDDRGANQSQLWTTRLHIMHDLGDFYAEFARPDWFHDVSYYLAASTSYSKFSLTMEYKNYNHLSFRNKYGTDYNAAPSLTREHSFTLLNRHPHALNMDNEKGYQFELTYLPTDELEMTINHSQTFTQNNISIFEEYYGEVHHYFSEKLDTRFAAAWTYDFSTNTENITPIADVLYNLTWRDQLHVSYQHQHTINKFDKSEFDNEFLLLEYSRSPLFSFALVGEYTNKDQIKNIELDENYWLYGNLTLSFWQNQEFSILVGSRQEGFVCVGGICRYEPEFEGIEIKLINRF